MTPPPDVTVGELLCALFDLEELQRFLRSQYRELADGLPGAPGLVPLAYAAAEALSRRNLIDDTLFARLRAQRPRCGAQIAAAQRAYQQAAARQVRSRRFTAVGLLAAAGSVAALAVWTWSDAIHSSSGRPPIAEPTASGDERGTLRCRDGMVFIHGERIGPLCLDRSEVTRAQFCALLPAAPRCTTRAAPVPDPTLPISRIRPQEAVACCSALGLRLPRRRELAEVLRLELGERTAVSLLPAMNLCGQECMPPQDRVALDFTHLDLHKRTAPVGSYRHAFASPLGLDDIFGNVREIVTEGERFFTCGAGYTNAQLADLQPEACMAAQSRPLDDTSSEPYVGFRCAAEPTPA